MFQFASLTCLIRIRDSLAKSAKPAKVRSREGRAILKFLAWRTWRAWRKTLFQNETPPAGAGISSTVKSTCAVAHENWQDSNI